MRNIFDVNAPAMLEACVCKLAFDIYDLSYDAESSYEE